MINKIKEKLVEKFKPSYIELIDDSQKHRKHIGYSVISLDQLDKNKGNNISHLRIIIICSSLNRLSLLEKHKLIQEELIEFNLHSFTINILNSKI